METVVKNGPGKGRVGKAGRLTRERVIDAGRQVAAAKGFDSLTMTGVAKSLGSVTMSLYYHVRDKDDLIAGMLDAVASEISFPDRNDEPIEDLTAIFGVFYETFLREPWVVRCLVEGHPGSPKVEPLVERAVIALENLGLHGAEAGHAFISLLHYTYGEVMVLEATSLKKHFVTPLDALNFPAIARTLGQIELETLDRDPYYGNLRRILVGYDRRDPKST